MAATFAELVARLESDAALLGEWPVTATIKLMLACIRDQQAVLKATQDEHLRLVQTESRACPSQVETRMSATPLGRLTTFAERVAEVAHDVDLGYAPDVPLQTLTDILACIREQQAALKAALPYIESQNGAEHMIDGLGPRTLRPSDADLKQARAVLTKWNLP